MATETAGTVRDIVFGNLRGRIATFTAVSDADTYNTGLRTIYFAAALPNQDCGTADWSITLTTSGGTVTFNVVAGTDTVNTAVLFVLGT